MRPVTLIGASVSIQFATACALCQMQDQLGAILHEHAQRNYSEEHHSLSEETVHNQGGVYLSSFLGLTSNLASKIQC